jgi:hypothetical protein
MKTELLTIPAPRPAEIGGGRHARLPRGLPPAGRVAADCTHHRDVCGHLLRCQSWYATPIAAFTTTSLRQLTLGSPSSVTLLQARSSLRTRSTSSRTRSSCSTRTCLTRRTAHACRSRTTAATFAASTLAPTFRTPSSCDHFTLVPRGRRRPSLADFRFLGYCSSTRSTTRSRSEKSSCRRSTPASSASTMPGRSSLLGHRRLVRPSPRKRVLRPAAD